MSDLMSFQKLEFPDVQEYRVKRAVLQLSSILTTVLKLQTSVPPSICNNPNQEDRSGTPIADPYRGGPDNPEDIDKEIAWVIKVLRLAPDGHPQKSILLAGLGALFNSRFECLGEPADSDKAVDYLTQAVHITPTGHELKPNWLNDLSVAYRSRFKRLGQLPDLDIAIECQTQAVLHTPEDHANKPYWLKNLGNSHSRRFQDFGEVTDLEKAIDCFIQAVSLTPSDHAHKLEWVNDLGLAHHTLFRRLGELAYLDKTIDCWTQAVMLIPNGHARKPGWLTNLGLSYLSRFTCLDELEALNKAIECQTQAVLLAPEGHSAREDALNNLGISHYARYKRLGELVDVDKAIDSLTQAVLLTPDGHVSKPVRLTNLGLSYMDRFERLGRLEDLDKAIECHTQAVQFIPDGQGTNLNSLSWLTTFYRDGAVNLSGADKVMEYNAQAVPPTPGGIVGKPTQLNSLGRAYLSRFKPLGEPSDLDKAIECNAQVVQPTPEYDVEKSHWLANLGTSYDRRFQRLGQLTDVDKAIDYLSQALLLIPVDDHLQRASWLGYLGGSYWSRFDRLVEVADLDKAIDCLTQAVLLAPDSYERKLDWLTSLGMSYLSRFWYLHDLADLEKAIECQTQVVQLAPEGFADRSTSLNNLGMSYQSRFDRLGELSDLSKAIEYKTQAVLHSPEGHAEKPRWLSNIGNSYRSRFEHLGELEDLGKAIQYQTQAIQLSPDGHAYNPLYLSNLARSYGARFNRMGDLVDLEHARSVFRDAARLTVTLPKTQIDCARMWARYSYWPGFSPRLAYERCMELIPHLIWVGRTINQRYSRVSQINDLVSAAAAWAISEEAYDLALEWLEQGRSIVWNQILQLRTPFDDLFAVDPALAQQLKDTSTKLEAAGSRLTPESPPTLDYESLNLERNAQYHRKLATEWERLLGQARNLPGLQSFLLARKAEELKLAATDGPVVVINIHSTRCDALIIFPNCKDIAHIPLQNFSLAKLIAARELLDSLLGRLGDRFRGFKRSQPEPKREDRFQSLLYGLWSDIVKPILDRLDCTVKMPVDVLPHVTWCTTGALSFLPLHAAGCYDGSQSNAFDLAVSSYTPTLSALLSSRALVFNPDCGVLAVGQEHTLGFSSLPNVVQELAVIEEHTKGTRFHQLNGEVATVEAVLDAMDTYSWVHLACHATQNPDNPAHSAFHLHDGPLTLEAITKRSFKNKGLAFLSACQTATGDERLSDEAVHLAAGMLMAGYPSVIATMWKIQDADGPQVAQGVYAHLLKHTGHHTTPVRSLHEAITGLREKVGFKAFERWVPFIHIGV